MWQREGWWIQWIWTAKRVQAIDVTDATTIYTTNFSMRYYGWLVTSWQKTGSSFNWKLWTWEICVMQMRSSTLHTPVLVLECCLAVNIFYHTCRSFFNLFLSRSIRHLYHRLGCPNVTARSSRAVTLKSRPKLCQHCRHRQREPFRWEGASQCLLVYYKYQEET